MAITDGVYEIRYANAPNMAVDVSGASTVKGANVQLYTVNHTNAQVFYITEESTGKWSIRNVSSGMYVDVKSGSATSGTNVQQWTSNNTRAQRWLITETGDTTTIDGVSCSEVTIGSYVTVDGDTYLLDVHGAMTTNKTNIQIYTKNGTDAQTFVLYPTSKEDPSLPIPSIQGWTSAAGATDYSFIRASDTTLYPAWLGTQSWASNTTNGFECCYRSRTMDETTATWDDWGSVTAWATATTTRDGTAYWLTGGLPATLAAGKKQLEYEIQVRSFAGAGNNKARGLVAVATLDATFEPVVTLSASSMSPLGLEIPYSSTYDGGTTNIEVTSIVVDGDEMLARPVRFDGLAISGSVTVPMDALNGWIEDSSTAAVTYKVGNDQIATYPDEHTSNVNVTYGGGSLTVTPTITVNDDRMLEVTATPGTITGAWVLVDGKLTEAEVVGGTAYAAYPFGTDFEVFVATDNGVDWGIANTSVTASSPMFGGIRPCHAFNWDGGSFLLELRDGEPLETVISMSADAESFALNGRKWESTYFGSVVSGTSTVEGSLIPGQTTTQREQCEALIRAHYVTYRSPHGDMWDVAITAVSPTTQYGWSDVSVTFRRESR